MVELTGDHFADWGAEAMLYTLDLYDGAGMRYYGGGRDLSAGRQALIVEHNGNQIGFHRLQRQGRQCATASDNDPGAVTCDFDWMEAEIARLRGEGYLPMVTFQHFEYYTYKRAAGPGAGLPPRGSSRRGGGQRQPGAPAAGLRVRRRRR